MTRARARRSWQATCGLVVALALVVSCGGGPPSGDSAATQGAPEPECRGTGIEGVRSTSHRVRAASSTRAVAMEWSSVPAATGYSFEFTKQRDTQPDATSEVAGATTRTSSLDLSDGEWYFHLQSAGGSAAGLVHCGPYVIATNLAQGTQAAKGTAARVRLVVRVDGGSSVEFHNFNRDKYYCGDTSLSGHPVQCELDVLAGSEVRIQRTLGLKNAEEARWRLASWGQSCAATNANVEPRGGQCSLLMDSDKTATVTFERRAMLHVRHEHAGGPNLGFAWTLGSSSQKSGGNPLAFRPAQQNCQFPHQPRQFAGPAADFREADPCDLYAMFDVGSEVTLEIGGGEPTLSTFLGWGGACSASGRSPTCRITLSEDSEVTSRWRVQ